jgi:spore photoproduct lyase
MHIQRIFFTPEALKYNFSRKILDRFQSLEKIKVRNIEQANRMLKDFQDPTGEGKKSLILDVFKGEFFKPCPCTPAYVSCGYKIISPVVGCPFDCSYCILQEYLNSLPIIVYVNLEDMFFELRARLENFRQPKIRLGTGELADSLALEPEIDIAPSLVQFFAGQDKMILELKTKSDNVSCLKDIDHGGRTVIAWSLNPEDTIKREEKGTATLEARLEAAQKVSEWGYKTGFHFDPIIDEPNAQEEYSRLAERIFEKIDPEKIAWISMGALRFMPKMESIIRKRFPESRLLLGELFPGKDSKLRYLRPRREQLFRSLAQSIRKFAPQIPIYLCMESETIWKKSLSKIPDEVIPVLVT